MPEAGSAGREAAGGQSAIYEVFRQERKGQPFQHAGSVEAPNETFAEIYAREQYGRRQESVALWVVPRDALHEIREFPDEFDLKYRRVDGYSIKTRLREARAAAESAMRLRDALSAGERPADG
jgi:ring-1,2-phenylacetyl-CoA epoxidase subunit PaaB